ncbi:transmembrane protein 106C-like isoform X1 [Silurus meridionalis]|uniref:transmembrane protein 106C-like isoform X1 n=2 Tax=Silurus meridionalis TaxID=175797 RepID=UPI001EEC6C29|nr:transmembrane protein 106C-like isoform X1 [Silurus meridionalis]
MAQKKRMSEQKANRRRMGGVRRMGGADGPVERVDDDDSLDGRDRQEDIARFPYVEFTGRDSITCPTCQGSGRIPSEQLNELVALIPYSDQRLQPQRTKQYVGLSVIVCLFICSLITFFMFPRPVLVEDGGIRSVLIHFDHDTSRVLINMTSALNFNNGNFFTVLVESVSSRVLYMKTVIGTQQLDNIISIQPLSQRQMNFTVSVEISGSLSYVYAFCTMASIKVHNIVVFTQTSVKTAYVVRSAQNTLEAYRYIDCGANSTLHPSAALHPAPALHPPRALRLHHINTQQHC